MSAAMTDNPTRCGFFRCTAAAIVQTWQTDTDYPGIVTLDRPLCGYHLDMELTVIQQLSNPLAALHVAALNTEVTRSLPRREGRPVSVMGRVVAAEFSDGLPHAYAHGFPACGLEDCECPEHEWQAEHPKPAGTYVTLKLDRDEPISLSQRWTLVPEVTR